VTKFNKILPTHCTLTKVHCKMWTRGWHGNGESGNTAVTAVITAGMGDISR